MIEDGTVKSVRDRRIYNQRGKLICDFLSSDKIAPINTNSSVESSRVESSLDIRSRRRTRCTVTTAPDDGHGTHSCSQHCLVLEQVGLELALE